MRMFYALFILLIATTLLYLPGLSGGLIFDDHPNLAPLGLWVNGEVTWQQVVLGNNSGPLGRPLSMASFIANVAIAGDSVVALKAGNLLLHLLTGVLVFFVMRKLISRDQRLSPHSSWLPIAITAVWLLHPMMVGPVLYVVQRMAILSAFFVLAALLAFLHGREKIEAGSARAGNGWLFIAVPLLTALAALSKENGLLAPLLCGVIEWVYFAPKNGNRRPAQARLFTLILIALPTAAALLLFFIQPGFYLEGYANRPFSVTERLLTQSRVLFDYVGNLLLPAGPTFSLLRDDYQISTTLFHPISTIFSTAGWILLIALAVAFRKTIPGFSAGIGIFLVGHAMESTVFPLMIYFEHRNYLPSLGIFLAVAGLLSVIASNLASKMDHPSRILQIGLIGLLLVLSGATFSRATIWSSSEALIRQSLAEYPSSVFLMMEMQRIHMTKPEPDVLAARRISNQLLKHERKTAQLIGMVNLLRIDCLVDGETDPDRVDRAFSMEPEALGTGLLTIIEALVIVVRDGNCKNLSPETLAAGIDRLVDQSSLSARNTHAWRLRFLAGQLYWAARDFRQSYSRIQSAWISSEHDPAVGLMLLELQISLGMQESAFELYGELDRSIKPFNVQHRRRLDLYREALANQFLNQDNSVKSELPAAIKDSFLEVN